MVICKQYLVLKQCSLNCETGNSYLCVAPDCPRVKPAQATANFLPSNVMYASSAQIYGGLDT